MTNRTLRNLRVETLESRHLLHGAGELFGTASGEGESSPMPDFTLTDVNSGSATANQAVSPRDYLEQVSGWYFGNAM
jgi:hypothetical protein